MVGYVPAEGALDTAGLDVPAEDLARALDVNAAEWREELPLIREWFDKFGESLPTTMRDELAALEQRLGG